MSGIEWTDRTWNPVRGCSRVSEGCRNCYAERDAARFSGFGLPFEGFASRTGAGARWTGRVELIEKKLEEPLSWKAPLRVFVNSMSDLWHESLPATDVAQVYDVMKRADWHTYQVLTKRPRRRRDGLRDHLDAVRSMIFSGHVWEGTSVESSDHYDRIDYLRQTPAAVRFLSLEPLLGPLPNLDLAGIHWVIVGGESGPGARPARAEWFDEIIESCRAQDVAVFVKQAGSVLARELGGKGKGGDMELWPERWRVREFPA